MFLGRGVVIFNNYFTPKLLRSARISMSTFVSTMSPTTGKMEWVLEDDDYDYHQEVARLVLTKMFTL